MNIIRLLLVTMNLAWLPANAQTEHPPIAAYGELPTISNMAISPDGEHLAYIQRRADGDALFVVELATNAAIFGLDIDDLTVQGISWASDKHVIMRSYETTRIARYRDRVRYTGAHAANIETKKVQQLLTGTEFLFPGQSGLGQIVGRLDGTDDVFMPAYTGSRTSQNPLKSLLRVNLDTGTGRMHSRGHTDGQDWYVDTDGTVLAFETYDEKRNEYRLLTHRSGEWETVLKVESELRVGVVGVAPERDGLAILLRNEAGFNELRTLSFDGEYSPVIMSRENTEIDYVLRDSNQMVFGVAYGGLQPKYNFFDSDLTRIVEDVQAQAPQASVKLESWSNGFSKLIFLIEGTGFAGDFFLFDRETSQLSRLMSSRPGIPTEAVGEVLTIEYKASDGLTIPGVMTVPNGSDMKNLPTIIMPHGGPEQHDQVGFDWMAQYFANRGYLVFQPNFRGSDGFGTAFTEAGYGGWGEIMQQDITDGVAALVRGGMIDPERVCIIGWSYGGYAALAGGAFTPDLYKCVGAIAPVSDLPRMLLDEKRDNGRHSSVLSYWEKAIANGDATRETLKRKSPVEFAENFQAPVLLIHGRDDLVVKINQSQRMKRALERAGKHVSLMTLKGDDHYLSATTTRLEALEALDAFVATHLGRP